MFQQTERQLIIPSAKKTKYKALNQMSLEQVKKKINELEQELKQNANQDNDELFKKILLQGIRLFTIQKANDLLDADNNLVVYEPMAPEEYSKVNHSIDELLDATPQTLSDEDLKAIFLFSTYLVANASMLRLHAEMGADYYRRLGLQCALLFVLGLCLGVIATAILAPLVGPGIIPLALFGIIVGSILGGSLLILSAGFILDLFKGPYLQEQIRLEGALLEVNGKCEIRKFNLIDLVEKSCPALCHNSIFREKIAAKNSLEVGDDMSARYPIMSLRRL